MTIPAPTADALCSRCGRKLPWNAKDRERCWECGKSLRAVRSTIVELAKGAQEAERKVLELYWLAGNVKELDAGLNGFQDEGDGI